MNLKYILRKHLRKNNLRVQKKKKTKMMGAHEEDIIYLEGVPTGQIGDNLQNKINNDNNDL